MESMIYEQQAHEQGFALVCGVDEAGAGPLMGPLYAQRVRQGLRRQGADALRPHDAQRRRCHLFPRELVFRSHRPHPLAQKQNI